MAHVFDETERYAALLTRLYPVMEVSTLIRPRLLLAALLTATEHIIMGVLYHTKNDAFQARLRFSSSIPLPFFRSTPWQPVIEGQLLEELQQKVSTEFAVLATRLGAESTIRLQFVPEASEMDIRDILLASPLPAAFS
jgi:hypothetical protein